MQSWSQLFKPLLDNPYVSGVIFREKNLSKKYCQSYELKVCFRKGLDRFKWILWISVGQRAAKLQDVKDEGMKKILLLGRSRTACVRPGCDT